MGKPLEMLVCWSVAILAWLCGPAAPAGARDFRAALISRSAGRRLPWPDRLRHGAALSTHLLDKSVASAELSARALRSRGCFDD